MHPLPAALQNIIGGRAYQPDSTGLSGASVLCFDDMVLKIEKNLTAFRHETAMMAWLADKLPVPKILYAEITEGLGYLLMSRIPGKMACDEAILQDTDKLVLLLAQALAMLQAVDTANCPCDASLDRKLQEAALRVQQNLCSTDDAEPGTYGPGGFETPTALLNWLQENRPMEDPVFSHGDFCLPNLFMKSGMVSGFIDLGRSGIADRYQDIALCYRSLLHNFDGTYGGEPIAGFDPDSLFAPLGITPDRDRIRYYILLDELF